MLALVTFGLPSPRVHNSLEAKGNLCTSQGAACCKTPKGDAFCAGELVCRDDQCLMPPPEHKNFQKLLRPKGGDEKEHDAAPAAPRPAKAGTAPQANPKGNLCTSQGAACCKTSKGDAFCAGELVCRDGQCLVPPPEQRASAPKNQAAPAAPAPAKAKNAAPKAGHQGNVCTSQGAACCKTHAGEDFCTGHLVCRDHECHLPPPKQQKSAHAKKAAKVEPAPHAIAKGKLCTSQGAACCKTLNGEDFCAGDLVCRDDQCLLPPPKQRASAQKKQAADEIDGEPSVPANPPQEHEDIAIEECYDDAVTKGNQCGEEHKATCTGAKLAGEGGECCSAGGKCGSDWTYCDNAQVEYSHGNGLCEEGMSADGFVVPEEERIAEQEEEEEEEEELQGCLADANVGSMQCGPEVRATCTGGDTGSVCCSAAGYCGKGEAFCGEDMQVDYSHGNGLCETTAPVSKVAGAGQQSEGQQAEGAAEKPHCLTMQQVANAWVHGVSPLSRKDAKGLCVAAVTIAAGSAYHLLSDGWMSPCDGKFDPLVEADGFDGKRKGLWQISVQFFDSPDPKRQAEQAYKIYTGDNETYGCLADWCIQSTPGCSAIIPGIGQDDPSVTEEHRFCHGVWSGASIAVPNKLQAIAVEAGTDGGEEVVQAACKRAIAKTAGLYAQASKSGRQERRSRGSRRSRRRARSL